MKELIFMKKISETLIVIYGLAVLGVCWTRVGLMYVGDFAYDLIHKVI
jgi:hypothetical protein